jgi:hypothetical protein
MSEYQLTIGRLKKQIAEIPDDLPVFFRRIAPICGNIEEASGAVLSQYSSWGNLNPCIIIEPFVDTPDDV